MAVFGVALLYFGLPPQLRLVPDWVPLILSFILVAPILWATGRKHYQLAHRLGYVVSIFQTLVLIGAVALLVLQLPQKKESGLDLLRSAGVLFPSNVLIFALWYWRIDSGGPYQREIAGAHVVGEFLFPQMTMDKPTREACGQNHWTPGFVDYLFLAFNTSTALSPADTAALTRIAKLMMMLQATISICIIVLLVGRAVNVL